jgi:transcriptional regulator with XRE-family HTH domain
MDGSLEALTECTLMDLRTIGLLVGRHRRSRKRTLAEVASAARVGRSTLAALESGKLAELGYAKVERICASVGLVLEARPTVLDAPLMTHRHLTEQAGRELTKAAIEDVIIRGGIGAWRGLAKAARDDREGRILARAREVAAALSPHDRKARAFAALLPSIAARSNGRRRAEA